MRPTLAVVCLLLVGFVSASTPGSASEREPLVPRLSGKDLPTADEMATIYPELAGGTRYVSRTDRFDINGGRNCVDIRLIGQPRQGVWGSYYWAAGEDPYFQGGESASPFLHKFGSTRAAKQVMHRLRAYVRRCQGRHQAEGTRGILDELVPPALGEETVGYQISWRYPNSVTGSSKRREVHVVVREGRRIVDVFLQAESFMPSLDNGVRVAQLTLSLP
jgi:hypothetical protein